MDKHLRRALVGRIRAICSRKAASGPFVITEAASEVAAELSVDPSEWTAMREHLANKALERAVRRILRKTPVAADSPERCLPGLENLPPIITVDGLALVSRELNLDQYRAEERRLHRRITNYSYERRKDAHLERDKKQLKEMRRFDPRFAIYAAAMPDLPLWKAKEIDTEQKSRPSAARKLKGD